MNTTRRNGLLGALLCLLAVPVLADRGGGKPAAVLGDIRGASKQVAVLEDIRAATSVFRDVRAAEAAGYVATACASGGAEGAMGVHYVNPGLLFDADGTPNAEFDLTTPEVLVYEPLPRGRLRLVGVEYIVFAETWDAAHPAGESPALRGQLFHFAGAPNRYRLPAFYQLHAWAWKNNPNGTFADWNPLVSCDHYDPA